MWFGIFAIALIVRDRYFKKDMFLDRVASIIDRYYLIFDENYKRLETMNILIISELRVIKFQKMYIFMYNGVYTLGNIYLQRVRVYSL